MKKLILLLVIALIACRSADKIDEDALMASFFRACIDEDSDLAYESLVPLIDHKVPIKSFILIKQAVITLGKQGDEHRLNQYVGSQSKLTRERLCNDQAVHDLNLAFCQEESYFEEVSNPAYRDELLACFVRDQHFRFNPEIDYVEKYELNLDSLVAGLGEADGDSVNYPIVLGLIEQWGLPTREKVGLDGMNAFCTFVLHADHWQAWQREMFQYLESLLPTDKYFNEFYAHTYDRIKVYHFNEKQRYGSHIDSIDRENKRLILEELENEDSLAIWREEMELLPMELYEMFFF